jgi:hypothetical protein
MQTLKQVVRKFVPRPIQTPPCPVAVERSEYSAIISVFDEPGRPTRRLVDVALEAVEKAMQDVEVEDSVWPGEELRLLGGLMLAMRPKVVAEIGRGSGKSARVMKRYLAEGGMYREFAEVAGTISEAEFVLISGPADGKFESGILEQLAGVPFKKPPIVMLNDTRRWEMLRFCRDISYPKVDMTSFGRWTGTLLVELSR